MGVGAGGEGGGEGRGRIEDLVILGSGDQIRCRRWCVRRMQTFQGSNIFVVSDIYGFANSKKCIHCKLDFLEFWECRI